MRSIDESTTDSLSMSICGGEFETKNFLTVFDILNRVLGVGSFTLKGHRNSLPFEIDSSFVPYV